MKHLLAIDQGTTSSRAMVFDESGAAVASARREIRPSFPQPGWVEHDAGEIGTTQAATRRDALAPAGLRPAS